MKNIAEKTQSAASISFISITKVLTKAKGSVSAFIEENAFLFTLHQFGINPACARYSRTTHKQGKKLREVEMSVVSTVYGSSPQSARAGRRARTSQWAGCYSQGGSN
jgi:hypothetical protein